MNIRKKRGVTLIALAVTVTVMLIIAGISLATINNSDNIITQSKKGVKSSELKEETDAIRIAIQETMLADSKGKVSGEMFQKYLKQHIEISNFEIDDKDETFSFQVVKSENKYVVKSNGEFSIESDN